MVKKITKYAKFVVCCALILSLVAPSYAALSASDGSAFVTKAEFDAALSDFNARLTTFEAGINSKIDSQVTSYLDRNGIWNGLWCPSRWPKTSWTWLKGMQDSNASYNHHEGYNNGIFCRNDYYYEHPSAVINSDWCYVENLAGWSYKYSNTASSGTMAMFDNNIGFFLPIGQVNKSGLLLTPTAGVYPSLKRGTGVWQATINLSLLCLPPTVTSLPPHMKSFFKYISTTTVLYTFHQSNMSASVYCGASAYGFVRKDYLAGFLIWSPLMNTQDTIGAVGMNTVWNGSYLHETGVCLIY